MEKFTFPKFLLSLFLIVIGCGVAYYIISVIIDGGFSNLLITLLASLTLLPLGVVLPIYAGVGLLVAMFRKGADE